MSVCVGGGCMYICRCIIGGGVIFCLQLMCVEMSVCVQEWDLTTWIENIAKAQHMQHGICVFDCKMNSTAYIMG